MQKPNPPAEQDWSQYAVSNPEEFVRNMLLLWSEGGRAMAGMLERADAKNGPYSAATEMTEASRIVIAGAGSSYYVAQIAAAGFREEARLPAVAVPASEILLRPRGVFGAMPAAAQPVIVISRAGTTSESIAGR